MIQNKHIIRLSFIGLFINIVANIVLYRYFMIEEVVLKQAVLQNSRIAQVYREQIWDANDKAVAKLREHDYQELLGDPDFIKIAKNSLEFFSTVDQDIVVYDKLGNKILANKESGINNIDQYASRSFYNKMILTMDKIFLRGYITDQALSESFLGRTRHVLVSRAVLTDKENNIFERSFINSYVPVIGTIKGKFKIDGVIKITTDVTEQWDNIAHIEKKIFAAFVVVFFIFFAIVMYNTNYAQRIINKQFETNRLLEEAKTKAESESTAKTEFLANVSHELRTPLNAVIGFSEIILAETYGKLENVQYKDYINDINNSGKHLLSVINDILDFSKASADRLSVDKVEIDLNKLAMSSMRFVKPRADEASVRLIDSMPEEHVIIFADPKRLKQAFLNLLSNSVKFTPTDGSVTMSIKVDKRKKLVYITVADTGIGMSDKDIPKALSSFGQVDNKLSRRYEGTGLGLPLTKKLVELMNGVFDLQSIPGKGTKVTLTFEYSECLSI